MVNMEEDPEEPTFLERVARSMRAMRMHYDIHPRGEAKERPPDEGQGVALCGDGSEICGIGPMEELEVSPRIPAEVRKDVETYLTRVKADWNDHMEAFADRVAELTGEQDLQAMQELTEKGPRLTFGRHEEEHSEGQAPQG